MIDSHSHQWELGFSCAPDFRDTTAAASLGGVTTILDHPLTTPVVTTVGAFEDKVRLGQRTSYLDFGLHAGATPATMDELPELWAAGATGVKFFTCRTNTVFDGFENAPAQRNLLARLAHIDALALVHAEDSRLLDQSRRRLLRDATLISPTAYAEWRTVAAERAAVAQIVDLAEETGARVYVVHVSHPDVVDVISNARRRGVDAAAETCPHYLILSASDLRRDGAWVATAPPIRDEDAIASMKLAVEAGAIAAFGSDHCAVGRAGKDVETAFEVVPGVPGVQWFAPLVLDLVAPGAISLRSVVEMTSSRPAAVFGIAHRKGRLHVGMDGDVTLVELDGSTDVRVADLIDSTDWSPYTGRRLRGRVAATIVRGAIVAQEGQVVGEPGFGRFVPRGSAGSRKGLAA